ncbi:MAG: hypothetical protein CVT95_02140 [Bacteroidetes bacterium HGW-Bacteroidetes-12]|nr:MAG: hypothetical protein CVT95_02140 [Bacteroidetes bacterium HGW-Bacteroidetes-12]
MKKLLAIVLLFAAVLPVVGQMDSVMVKKKNASKNQIDLDVQFLGVEGVYKRKFLNKLYIGYSFGGGLLLRGNGEETFFDRIKHKLFFDYQLSDKIHIYQGLTYSSIFISSSDDNSGVAVGIETGIFYKLHKIEIGIEPSFMFFNEGDWRFFKEKINNYEFRGVITSLIILKIPITFLNQLIN